LGLAPAGREQMVKTWEGGGDAGSWQQRGGKWKSQGGWGDDWGSSSGGRGGWQKSWKDDKDWGSGGHQDNRSWESWKSGGGQKPEKGGWAQEKASWDDRAKEHPDHHGGKGGRPKGKGGWKKGDASKGSPDASADADGLAVYATSLLAGANVSQASEHGTEFDNFRKFVSTTMQAVRRTVSKAEGQTMGLKELPSAFEVQWGTVFEKSRLGLQDLSDLAALLALFPDVFAVDIASSTVTLQPGQPGLLPPREDVVALALWQRSKDLQPKKLFDCVPFYTENRAEAHRRAAGGSLSAAEATAAETARLQVEVDRRAAEAKAEADKKAAAEAAKAAAAAAEAERIAAEENERLAAMAAEAQAAAAPKALPALPGPKMAPPWRSAADPAAEPKGPPPVAPWARPGTAPPPPKAHGEEPQDALGKGVKRPWDRGPGSEAEAAAPEGPKGKKGYGGKGFGEAGWAEQGLRQGLRRRRPEQFRQGWCWRLRQRRRFRQGRGLRQRWQLRQGWGLWQGWRFRQRRRLWQRRPRKGQRWQGQRLRCAQR